MSRATGIGGKPHVPGINTRFSTFGFQYAAHHEKVLFAQIPPPQHPIISDRVSVSVFASVKIH